jgi:5'-nucleotidase
VKILVSNDDGIYADGIWALARELSKIAEVAVVAPDREQSAVGTATTLRKPLRVQKINPLAPGIESYSVEGSPSDSVIVALGKVISQKVDLVVSGVNQGSNLGEDVLISGTVGAALAAYLRGYPAIAISSEVWQEPYLSDAARVATLLAKRLDPVHLPSRNLLLNVNIPNLPLNQYKGIKITRLAHKSHVNTVDEGHDGRKAYYMLMRESINNQADRRSDIWAHTEGYISITPLQFFPEERFPRKLLQDLTVDFLEELNSPFFYPRH